MMTSFEKLSILNLSTSPEGILYILAIDLKVWLGVIALNYS
jgi:hypothetical protein